MSKNVFLAFILISNFCFSQDNFISGKVINDNSESLAYVNIGIKNKGVGTVSNKDGKFKFVLNDKVKLTDTVEFSFIGFKTQKIQVSELKKMKDPVKLEAQEMILDEVVFTTKKVKLKQKRIGSASKRLGLLHSNFYSYYEKEVDDRLSKELGLKFNIKNNCAIKDLNFKITQNEFKSLKFRLNFYKVEDGLPTDLIVHQNIIFEIEDGYTGWYSLDLKPYDIYLSENVEEVAVTIQWVESVKLNNNSKYFSIAASLSPFRIVYSRDKTMDVWNKSDYDLSFYLNAMCD